MIRMAHEWGYRWTWPPLISELKPWQWQLMTLAQRTENYITEQSRAQSGRGGVGGHFGNPSARYDGYDSAEDLLRQYQ